MMQCMVATIWAQEELKTMVEWPKVDRQRRIELDLPSWHCWQLVEGGEGRVEVGETTVQTLKQLERMAKWVKLQ
jgi:hypothetical protein